jgi:hypothetical protein
MVYTPFPGYPVNEILPYGSTMHFVSVVWNRQHYSVLYYNIEKRSVTVLDGLNQDIRKWQDHIIHTVKTNGLKPLFSSQVASFGITSMSMNVLVREQNWRGDIWYWILVLMIRKSHGRLKTSNPTCKVMVSVVDQLHA